MFDTDIKNCEFYMSDTFGNFQFVPCKEPFSLDNAGITVTINSNGKRLTTIPLRENFSELKLKFIRNFYFVANPNATKGQIIYEISNIKFLK
jgi:hypothetical protein